MCPEKEIRSIFYVTLTQLHALHTGRTKVHHAPHRNQCFTFQYITKSSATAKSTARLSCLGGVLYDIYRETNNRSTANQPLVRNWP